MLRSCRLHSEGELAREVAREPSCVVRREKAVAREVEDVVATLVVVPLVLLLLLVLSVLLLMV